MMDAFAAEARAVQDTLADVEPEDWDKPGLGEWTVAELVAHLIRAADRITAYLNVEVEGTQPACDRVAYFDFSHLDRADMASAVAGRSRDDAARYGVSTLVDRFSAAVDETLTRCRDLSEDHLIHTIQGPMELGEYAATRVLELTVHHMDLCQALGRRAATTDEGLAVTAQILTAMLEGEHPETLDLPSFVLAATGRLAHPDPRFPVLS